MKDTSIMKSYRQYKKDALKDPELKAAYDALESEYRLAESLIKARLAKKWTQGQLAARAGVTQNTITRLESGVTNPTVATLNRVASALGKELRVVAIR
jgi:DNA-binding XRE family transcriptional regulator